jgi:hypothetical protein
MITLCGKVERVTLKFARVLDRDGWFYVADITADVLATPTVKLDHSVPRSGMQILRDTVVFLQPTAQGLFKCTFSKCGEAIRPYTS